LSGLQGSVVSVSSIMAVMPGNKGLMQNYGVAKAAQDALTRNLAFELAPKGVRVNSVLPGAI
jgi:NAD(P)-dependent dehydrogenase (short-subunit alcohol dehydrogenase family)